MLLCFMTMTINVNAAMAKGSKWVGNIIAGSVPSNYLTYWNQVTPENGTKWGSVEGTRDRLSWGNADTIYNYALSNGIPFKFHTLVWGSQYPSWITSLSEAEQKAEVLEWIQEAGKKYPKSDFVDVVNEPLHSPAPFRNAIGGAGSTGWDWIVWSFEQARLAFPNSKLLINEYGIISDPNAANNYIKIINILKSKGLVDGIGIQCHQFNMDTVSVSTMKNVLNMLGATGLPIYVSELDITGADDTTQLNRYKEKFPVLYESPYVKGITLWGYQYKSTWIDNTWLMNSSGGERTALSWMKDYLANVTLPSDGTPTPVPTVAPRSAFSQLEAESFNDQSGIQTETCSEGGEDIGYIENGDYVVYKSIDFGNGASRFNARIASATSGGNIEIRLDSVSGSLIGTCPIPATGDWQTWVTANCSVSGVTGKHDLYLKFTGDSGYLFNLNWMKFDNQSVVTPTPTTSSNPNITTKGDLNIDGVINLADVVLLASAFNAIKGDSKYVASYDLNDDGAINMADVIIIAGNFGITVTVSTNTPTKAPTPTKVPTPTPTATKVATPTATTTVSPSSNKPSYRKIGNPYLPGWEYIPDGEPRVFGDRVYVYGSHDNANSTKFCDTKLRVWSAPLNDLENWRDEGDAFHSKADDEGKDDLPYTDNDLYAPDVVEKGGKYYLYYYVVGAAGGVAVSDSPAGPFKYLSRYANGNNQQFPDPGVLVDTDGSVYMYYGFQGSYMCQMNPNDMYTILPNTTISNLVSTSAPFYFFEAASMRKIGNTYYLIYSPNNATTTLVYATSSSPKGPFTYKGTIINSGKNYPGANNHGSICNINGQWYIFYHRMTNNTMYSRKGCVEKINILPDGSIPEVEMTSMGFSKSLSPYQENPADLSCYLTGGNYSTEIDKDTRPVINNRNNSVIGFKYFDFTRTTSAQTTFSAKIRYGKTAGKMEIRLDNPTSGTLIGTLNIGSKSGDTNWYTLTTDVSNVTGSHALYFRFTGASSSDSICDITSFEFK